MDSKLGMKRKKSTLIKVVIAVPVLYFSVVGFLVTISGRGIPDVRTSDDLSLLHKRDLLNNEHGGAGGAEQLKWDAKNAEHHPRHATHAPPGLQRDPLVPPVDLHVEHDDHVAKLIQENDRRRSQLRHQQQRVNEDSARHKLDVKAADPNAFKVTNPPGYDPNAPGKQTEILHKTGQIKFQPSKSSVGCIAKSAFKLKIMAV